MWNRGLQGWISLLVFKHQRPQTPPSCRRLDTSPTPIPVPKGVSEGSRKTLTESIIFSMV